MAACLVLGITGRRLEGDVVTEVGFLSVVVLFTILGSLIASRRPGNRMSWLFFAVGFGTLLLSAGNVAGAGSPDPWARVIVVVASVSIAFLFFPLFLILHLFPTGEFVSRRWRWAGWLTGVMVFLYVLLGVVFTRSWEGGSWMVENPIGFVPTTVFDGGLFATIWYLGLIVLVVGGLAAMVVRYRTSEIVVRTQIKWVLYAVGVFAVTYVVTTLTQDRLAEPWGTLLLLAVTALIPVSVAFAITRYRLFDIDRIVSRTLSYSIVVALLAGAFFGLVALVTSVLPSQNAMAVAGSTLTIAALFNPLRRRVQHAVDRRFNRSGYQAEVVSARFAADLMRSLTIDEVVDVCTRSVGESFQPEMVGVWIAD